LPFTTKEIHCTKTQVQTRSVPFPCHPPPNQTTKPVNPPPPPDPKQFAVIQKRSGWLAGNWGRGGYCGTEGVRLFFFCFFLRFVLFVDMTFYKKNVCSTSYQVTGFAGLAWRWWRSWVVTRRVAHRTKNHLGTRCIGGGVYGLMTQKTNKKELGFLTFRKLCTGAVVCAGLKLWKEGFFCLGWW
jgi:hypothetical protein